MGDIVEISAYFIPKKAEINRSIEKVYPGVNKDLKLIFPVLDKETVVQTARQVQTNRSEYLSNLKITEIVDVIDRAVQQWLNPMYHYRQLAEEWLPVMTGYNPEMVRLELKRLMRTFRKKELFRFLDEEFDNPAVLDEFRPRKKGGLSRAFGPKSIFHIFSGNVPGLPIWSIIMGLLVKASTLGKTSSQEPLMSVLFAKSIADIDPKLADSIAILPWKGGTEDLEDAAIGEVETTIAYGSNQSIENLRNRVPSSKTFISYGHKVSFAMIGKEALTADLYQDTAHKLADDVSLFDQQSCLSPHTVFVEEGGAVTAKVFAQLLAGEMTNYDHKRPRAVLSDDEALAIRSIRDQYELKAMTNANVEVYQSTNSTNWTVIYHQNTALQPSPLNRTIHVVSCSSLEKSVICLAPYQEYLQTAGVAVPPQRLFHLSEELGKAGVDRICSIGHMPRTEAAWHHDGRFNLLDLIRWTDIEINAEDESEKYDPDVE